jgi:hypothetical protein
MARLSANAHSRTASSNCSSSRFTFNRKLHSCHALYRSCELKAFYRRRLRFRVDGNGIVQVFQIWFNPTKILYFGFGGAVRISSSMSIGYQCSIECSQMHFQVMQSYKLGVSPAFNFPKIPVHSSLASPKKYVRLTSAIPAPSPPPRVSSCEMIFSRLTALPVACVLPASSMT